MLSNLVPGQLRDYLIGLTLTFTLANNGERIMGNNVGRAEHAKYESTEQFTQALVARFGSHTNNSGL